MSVLTVHNTVMMSFFSEAEIKQFLGAATANDLIVIPLVQTFGHLEVQIKYNYWYYNIF